jgi:molybdenum cofactor cytidylyltransferase
MSGITGILLAAGRSRRFGSDKRLASVSSGQPSLLVGSWQSLQAHCERTWVVLGPGDDELSRQLERLGASVILSQDSVSGMGHSLADGVKASADADGWIIALADMPLIQSETYALIVKALVAGATIARPVFEGRAGHPVGFSRPWYGKLVRLDGDEGARRLLRKAQDQVVHCPVDDAGVLYDVDTVDDLRSLASTPNRRTQAAPAVDG